MTNNSSSTSAGPSGADKLPEAERGFFPSGAIAFFIALVILCLGIWFGIYFIMLERV